MEMSKLLLVMILAFFVSPLAFADVQCVSVYPTDDAEIDASTTYEDIPLGLGEGMTSCQSPCVSRSLMKFNLTSGIGESRNIINCSIRMYVQGSGGGANATFQHNRNDNWFEANVTWNNFVGNVNGTAEGVLSSPSAGNWYIVDNACNDMSQQAYENASDRILSIWSTAVGGTPVNFVTFGTRQSADSPELIICSDECSANFTLESNTTYCYNDTSIVQNEYYVDQNQCNSSYLSYSVLNFEDCSGGTPDCVNATCVCNKTAYGNWVVTGACEYSCGIEPVGVRGVDEGTCTYYSEFPLLSLMLVLVMVAGLLAFVARLMMEVSSDPSAFIKRIIAIVLLVAVALSVFIVLKGML